MMLPTQKFDTSSQSSVRLPLILAEVGVISLTAIAVAVIAVIVALNAGAQAPVAWATFFGWAILVPAIWMGISIRRKRPSKAVLIVFVGSMMPWFLPMAIFFVVGWISLALR